MPRGSSSGTCTRPTTRTTGTSPLPSSCGLWQLVDEVARDGDVGVLAGDFNLFGRASCRSCRRWSEYGPGVDHVIARGATATPLVVWPKERRAYGDRLLSDHAPVETIVG